MKVVSVNIGERRKIQWRSKSVETGIFKYPVDKIALGVHDVDTDQVVDRKYHGGADKACYLFSADVYDFWKAKYPKLDWDWGMFGENITVSGLDESQMMIGAQYRIGEAVVEVSEPRQPCFKLGIRFGTQKILKEYIAQEHSGVYIRVLKPGIVKSEDELTLLKEGENLSVQDVFRLIYKKSKDMTLLENAKNSAKLAISSKNSI